LPDLVDALEGEALGDAGAGLGTCARVAGGLEDLVGELGEPAALGAEDEPRRDRAALGRDRELVGPRPGHPAGGAREPPEVDGEVVDELGREPAQVGALEERREGPEVALDGARARLGAGLLPGRDRDHSGGARVGRGDHPVVVPELQVPPPEPLEDDLVLEARQEGQVVGPELHAGMISPPSRPVNAAPGCTGRGPGSLELSSFVQRLWPNLDARTGHTYTPAALDDPAR